MAYIKIDDNTIAEVKEVQTKYNIEEIKREIELLDREITDKQDRKTELLAIIGEATKLGIKTEIK